MSAGHMNELLDELHSGKLDPVGAAEFLGGARLSELLPELRTVYPVLFQERRIGRKHEVGMARLIRFSLAPRHISGSRFLSMQLRPVLQRCLLVSGYDDVVTEVTQLAGMTIRPSGTAPRSLVLKSRRGYKLDKDGNDWRITPLGPKSVTLAEAFLEQRGWKFESLVPFLGEPARAAFE